MENLIIITVIAAVLVSVITGVITYFGVKTRAKSMLKEAESAGEMIKKEKILQAKEKFIQLKSD